MPTPMPSKNIAIFCDGTWQHLDQRNPTNVNRLARCVEPFDAANVPQLVRYDDGVGVATGVLDHTTQLVGGAFGEGLENKVMRAYESICLNFVPGDKLFIFGFSRGAYTARCLAGLLNLVWVLRRDQADKIALAQEIYHDPIRRQEGQAKMALDATIANFRQAYCHPAEQAAIAYVGVWDTVGELGVPKALMFSSEINRRFRFFDTSLSKFTQAARHAVAIDETRDTYAPTLWDNIDALNADAGAAARPYAERPYQQQWFPGHHSGVGGGQEDGGLSLGAMAWIAEGAARAGLVFNTDAMTGYRGREMPDAPFAVEKTSLSDLLTREIGGVHPRVGPTTMEQVSDVACARWAKVAEWRATPALAHVAGQM